MVFVHHGYESVSRAETHPFYPCLVFTRRLSWGFQRSPLHRTELTRSTPTWNRPCLRIDFSSFRPAFAKDRSCSAFMVSHHLDGLLPREFRGFVALRSRSWGSSRCGFDASGVETPNGLLLPQRQTLRRISTLVAVHHVSMVLLDTCPLVVRHGEVVRLQGFSPRAGSRATGGLAVSSPRTSSLGFSSFEAYISTPPNPAPKSRDDESCLSRTKRVTSFWWDGWTFFQSEGNCFLGFLFRLRSGLNRSSFPCLQFSKTALEKLRLEQSESVAGPVWPFWSFPIGKVRGTASTVKNIVVVQTSDRRS
jgi:hypothetical protein